MQELKRTNIYTKSCIAIITNIEESNNNVKSLSRKCGLPWCHVKAILTRLNELKVIKLSRPKKTLVFNITKKGLLIQESFFKINQYLRELENE